MSIRNNKKFPTYFIQNKYITSFSDLWIKCQIVVTALNKDSWKFGNSISDRSNFPSYILRKHVQLKLKHPDKQKNVNGNFNSIENHKPKKKLGFKLGYLKYSMVF